MSWRTNPHDKYSLEEKRRLRTELDAKLTALFLEKDSMQGAARRCFADQINRYKLQLRSVRQSIARELQKARAA